MKIDYQILVTYICDIKSNQIKVTGYGGDTGMMKLGDKFLWCYKVEIVDNKYYSILQESIKKINLVLREIKLNKKNISDLSFLAGCEFILEGDETKIIEIGSTLSLLHPDEYFSNHFNKLSNGLYYLK